MCAATEGAGAAGVWPKIPKGAWRTMCAATEKSGEEEALWARSERTWG